MSNYNSLKATIDANIKQNGNQEITGQILNSVLNQMVNILGAGYQFAGVATIATNPGTPDAKVFYIANGKGTYEKFGGINVTEDDVVVLYWDTAWHKVATGIASQAKLSELDNIVFGREEKPLTDITESAEVFAQKIYDADLQLVNNQYSTAYKIDISEYRNGVLYYKAYYGDSYNGHSGFINSDGTLSSVNQTSSGTQQEIQIPSNAKYFCCSFILSLANQKFDAKVDGEDGIVPVVTETTALVKDLNEIVKGQETIDKDITNDDISTSNYVFNVELKQNVTSGGTSYKGYKFDVEEYVGTVVSFFAYSNDSVKGYNGFILKDNSTSDVFITTDWQHKQELTIPENAKYLCISWAKSLGNQDVRVYKEGVPSIKEEIVKVNQRIDELIPQENTPYNDVISNKSKLQSALIYMSMFANLPETVTAKTQNRFIVAFNGDSIIGSQLDDITKSPQYNTGDFPPNMSKMIMARLFWERYRFEGEDVQFRNLIHSAWDKVGFNVNNGKDDKAQTFNEIEVYGCSDGDYAQINTSGYKYVKVVWSEYKGKDYSFDVMRSIDNGVSFQKIDTINVTSSRRLMVAYKIYIIPYSSCIIKIIPKSGFANVCLWGVELWNSPRLDVVVGAFSGSKAGSEGGGVGNVEYLLDSYWSTDMKHTPNIVITDVLALNDYSFMKDSSYTMEQWRMDLKSIYKYCQETNTPILAFGTHQPMGQEYPTIKMAKGIAIQNNLAYIDILEKIRIGDFIFTSADGLHLDNNGNQSYFEELVRIFG